MHLVMISTLLSINFFINLVKSSHDWFFNPEYLKIIIGQTEHLVDLC